MSDRALAVIYSPSLVSQRSDIRRPTGSFSSSVSSSLGGPECGSAATIRWSRSSIHGFLTGLLGGRRRR